MKTTSALFLVQTPLHVINAIEAINQFGIIKSTFFIVTSAHNVKWKLMMENMLPNNVKRIYCIRNDYDLEEGTKAYATHISYLKEQCFDFVFFADARLYIFVDIVNSLNVSSTFLMDDGTGTLLAIHSLLKNGTYYDMSVNKSPERQKDIERIKRKYGLWSLAPVKYNLFTVFDYMPCKYFDVVSNAMTRISYTHRNPDENTVLLIGQPFVQIMHMTADAYLHCLRRVENFYEGKKIAYLPHPREGQSFIESLSESSGFEIIETTLNAENYIINRIKAPQTICGFLSTSLWNIAKFQKGINVESFQIPDELFSAELRVRRTRSNSVTDLGFLNIIYDYYKSRMPVYPL